MIKRLRMSVVLGAVLLLGATACGESADAGSGGSGSGAGGSGGDSKMNVKVVEPADGATLDGPFKLKVDSSVKLAPMETGEHHLHLYFDGDDSNYELVLGPDWDVPADSPALA